MLLLLLSEFEAELVSADFSYSVWDYFMIRVRPLSLRVLMVPNVNIYNSTISL